MNVTDYIYLINKPDRVLDKQAEILDKVLDEFPYFQSARAIQLKQLYNQNSFKYNIALKKTAAYSTDRAVLFDFITSDSFIAIDKKLYDKKALTLFNTQVVDSEIVVNKEEATLKANNLEQSILTTIKKAAIYESKDSSKKAQENLAIGKPLDFSKNEQHSFQEWLQLSRFQPIQRKQEKVTNQITTLKDVDKIKKSELIDKFIETSPKISPVKHGVPSTVVFDLNASDNSYLMTETLARVYLEQKKYQKAIQAYQILILKYPEKSSFFADRISDIKILQHNNN
ncbi:tetratricopeptide (TPR) repeat protein [Flavobacterium sp. PL11]|jgi:tetratricopeptide (TPR) repeat protein|uniref:tetratricopeptide repeat protein n=1 Tax=Flavobacterium sp. PL11 TaxID=3071717 RepID=UPI002E022390|nr:tetratricopeptide (TPR) repeat protein [Flavobacterium sp. PL11]